ncbi:MAG: hypothetical protein PWQ53_1109, partial [Bacteroidota bacterium]|nr:hypothetical protein [Bacteroidota bacterium]
FSPFYSHLVSYADFALICVMSFTKYLGIHLCFVISEINEYVKRDAFFEKVLHLPVFNFSKNEQDISDLRLFPYVEYNCLTLLVFAVTIVNHCISRPNNF